MSLFPARYIESSGTLIASTSAQTTRTTLAMKNNQTIRKSESTTSSSPGQAPIPLGSLARWMTQARTHGSVSVGRGTWPEGDDPRRPPRRGASRRWRVARAYPEKKRRTPAATARADPRRQVGIAQHLGLALSRSGERFDLDRRHPRLAQRCDRQGPDPPGRPSSASSSSRISCARTSPEGEWVVRLPKYEQTGPPPPSSSLAVSSTVIEAAAPASFARRARSDGAAASPPVTSSLGSAPTARSSSTSASAER